MTEQPKKDLILINPKCGGIIVRNITLPFLKLFFGPPMSLLTLAALTPKDYNIRIFNLKTFWRKEDFPQGALVGITSYTKNVKQAYRIADRYKKAGCHVVMGGPHVSALPEEALAHCHSVVIGEAESVWPNVLEDHKKGKLNETYSGTPVADWHTRAFDYLLRLTPRQLQHAGIYASRGCKYNCDYCVVAGRKDLRFAPCNEVIQLVERIKSGIRKPVVLFNDDNIFTSPGYAKELFRRLVPLDIRWHALSSIDIALDEEALELARKSGCISLQIGFESIHPNRLLKAGYLSSSADYLRLIRKIRKKKIRIIGCFMMGFDYDTPLDYLRLLVFLAQARLFHILLGILTPFPGTALYFKLLKEKRITSFDWGQYEVFHVVFKPKNMSAFALRSWFMFVRIISLFLAPLTLPFALIALYEVVTKLIPFAEEWFYQITF